MADRSATADQALLALVTGFAIDRFDNWPLMEMHRQDALDLLPHVNRTRPHVAALAELIEPLLHLGPLTNPAVQRSADYERARRALVEHVAAFWSERAGAGCERFRRAKAVAAE